MLRTVISAIWEQLEFFRYAITGKHEKNVLGTGDILADTFTKNST